ncbi:MAG TPA: hypothetical protein VFS43_00760 [Polyangiaceae bacterium]|nr:hypothetical protein [Polyangiaceae bacterium]
MVLVRVRFRDWAQFWSVFTQAGAERRREHGSSGVRVLRDADAPGEAWLLFDWERERFERFLADPLVRETMTSGGALGPPEVRFVDQVDELPA